MMIENKTGRNQENTNLVGIAPVIDIIGVVDVIEIENEIAVTAMIPVARIPMIEKGVDEIGIESIAIDTMTKRGKGIEENDILGAGAEVLPTKKKTADMNVKNAMIVMTEATCEHTH